MVEITAFRLESKPCKVFFFENKFSTNESTRIITSHVTYNLAYNYKFQLKTFPRLDEEWKLQEDGLRERFRKERDAELDRVVQKLEAEVITGRKTMESEFSERMRYNLLPTYILGLIP